MTLFGKPANLEEAYRILEQLQGRTHQVVTAICLMLLRNHRQRVFCESTSVTFRTLDAVQVRRYLTRVDPLDKAGAYAIQEDGDQIVESISGSYTNVIGLPLEALAIELQTWAGLPVVFNPSLYPMPSKFNSGSQPSQFLP
jgi:septum formation protein